MTIPDLEIIAEAGERTIVTRRTFAAPKATLFAMWTEPRHLTRWWGPRALSLVVCEVDLRVGGAYRYVERAPDGQEFAFRGTFREIRAPDRIVRTFVFEAMPQHEAIETILFEETSGRTVVTSTLVHDSVEARDGHVASGMEPGLRETYGRLDELLGEGPEGAGR